MLDPIKNALTIAGLRALISKIKGSLAAKVDMTDVVSSWQSTPDHAHVPSEKLVKDTIDNLPPGTAVKGDDESEYRTGNVNLTPANIGAYSKTESDSLLSAKEKAINKKQSVDPTSTTDYLSAKAVADFVNSSVATNTANFLGNFSLTDLGLTYPATDVQIAAALNSYTWPTGVTPTNNDYVYVEIQDPQTSGVDDKVERFKFSSLLASWGYEYTLNNSSFTAAEIAAIDSGITATDKTAYDNHLANTSNPHSVTKAQVGLGSVVNTGDSSTPVSGGTTKFTTGGAFTELAKKADKVSGATSGNLAGLDANGNLTDSGKKASDFALDTPTFTQTSTRANLNGSGESMATILGKIKKWFADLGTAAFKTLVISWSSTTSNDNVPSEKLVKDSLDGKLGTSGDGSNVSVTPDGTSAGTDIGNSTTLKVWAQKFKNLVGALKALAFKDKASYSDLSSGVQSSLDKADTALQYNSTSQSSGSFPLLVNDSGTGKYNSDITLDIGQHEISGVYASFGSIDVSASSTTSYKSLGTLQSINSSNYLSMLVSSPNRLSNNNTVSTYLVEVCNRQGAKQIRYTLLSPEPGNTSADYLAEFGFIADSNNNMTIVAKLPPYAGLFSVVRLNKSYYYNGSTFGETVSDTSGYTSGTRYEIAHKTGSYPSMSVGSAGKLVGQTASRYAQYLRNSSHDSDPLPDIGGMSAAGWQAYVSDYMSNECTKFIYNRNGRESFNLVYRGSADKYWGVLVFGGDDAYIRIARCSNDVAATWEKVKAGDADYAAKIGTYSSHPQIGSPSTPVYVDTNGEVKACDPSQMYVGNASTAQYAVSASNAQSNSTLETQVNKGLYAYKETYTNVTIIQGDIYGQTIALEVGQENSSGNGIRLFLNNVSGTFEVGLRFNSWNNWMSGGDVIWMLETSYGVGTSSPVTKINNDTAHLVSSLTTQIIGAVDMGGTPGQLPVNGSIRGRFYFVSPNASGILTFEVSFNTSQSTAYGGDNKTFVVGKAEWVSFADHNVTAPVT